MAVKSTSNDLFLPYIYQNNDKLLNLFIYNWTTKKKNEEDLKKVNSCFIIKDSKNLTDSAYYSYI